MGLHKVFANLRSEIKLKRALTAAVLMVGCTGLGVSAEEKNADMQDAPPVAKAGLTYKGVNIQLNGFLASETAYRSNNTASDIATNYSKIPFSNSPGYDVSEFRGTERQSRFSLLAQGDADSETHLSGYYELDFLGTSPTANANESNSYTPRTRHVYGAADWDDWGLHVLAGQNWSLAVLNTKGITPRNEYVPQTIDAQYAVGFDWARQWQLRIVKDWGKTYWAAVSFENSQTVGLGGTANAGTGNNYQLAPGALMSNNLSFNSYPDIIAKFAYESGFGHYEIFGLARNFESRWGGTTVATQAGKQSIWTESLGLGFTIPVWPKSIDISANGLFGKGIGRYGTGSLSDVTYDQDGSLKPLNATHYLVQVAWHATPHLETYATYGQEKVSAASGTGYGYGDGIVASNAGCTTLGGTCNPNISSITQANLGLWWSFYKGDYGTAKLGAQYSHTIVNTFADAKGVSPTTTEDMIFTSLRYYPF